MLSGSFGSYELNVHLKGSHRTKSASERVWGVIQTKCSLYWHCRITRKSVCCTLLSLAVILTAVMHLGREGDGENKKNESGLEKEHEREGESLLLVSHWYWGCGVFLRSAITANQKHLQHFGFMNEWWESSRAVVWFISHSSGCKVYIKEIGVLCSPMEKNCGRGQMNGRQWWHVRKQLQAQLINVLKGIQRGNWKLHISEETCCLISIDSLRMWKISDWLWLCNTVASIGQQVVPLCFCEFLNLFLTGHRF